MRTSKGKAEAPPRRPAEAYSYGDDPTLDALQDSCEAGDMAACDDLYGATPAGSAYEAHGSTCGERAEPRAGGCVDWQAESEEAPVEPSAGPVGLQAACEAGDLAACDSLWAEAPVDSEQETFGATCGGRGAHEGGTCVAREGTF